MYPVPVHWSGRLKAGPSCGARACLPPSDGWRVPTAPETRALSGSTPRLPQGSCDRQSLTDTPEGSHGNCLPWSYDRRSTYSNMNTWIQYQTNCKSLNDRTYQSNQIKTKQIKWLVFPDSLTNSTTFSHSPMSNLFHQSVSFKLHSSASREETIVCPSWVGTTASAVIEECI